MSDLISRSALKKEIVKLCELINVNYGIHIPTLAFTRVIDHAPSVEYPFYQEAYQTGYEEGYAQGYIDGSTGADWRGEK